jgi:hypothetical protein
MFLLSIPFHSYSRILKKKCTFRSESGLYFLNIFISFRFPFYFKSNLLSDLKVRIFVCFWVYSLENWILFENNWSKNVCKFTYLCTHKKQCLLILGNCLITEFNMYYIPCFVVRSSLSYNRWLDVKH